MQRHIPEGGPGEGGTGGIGVVVGLEDDDLVTGIDQPQEGRRQRLGAAGGDRDLGVGVDLEPGVAPEPGGDGLVELRHPLGAGVLVVATVHGGDSGLLDELRTVEIGEALTEVDRPVLDGERRVLGEHGLPEPVPTTGNLHGRSR